MSTIQEALAKAGLNHEASDAIGSCPTCDRAITEQSWGGMRRLGFIGHSRLGHLITVEIRECVCTSPVGRQVELPMVKP